MGYPQELLDKAHASKVIHYGHDDVSMRSYRVVAGSEVRGPESEPRMHVGIWAEVPSGMVDAMGHQTWIPADPVESARYLAAALYAMILVLAPGAK